MWYYVVIISLSTRVILRERRENDYARHACKALKNIKAKKNYSTPLGRDSQKSRKKNMNNYAVAVLAATEVSWQRSLEKCRGIHFSQSALFLARRKHALYIEIVFTAAPRAFANTFPRTLSSHTASAASTNGPLC